MLTTRTISSARISLGISNTVIAPPTSPLNLIISFLIDIELSSNFQVLEEVIKQERKMSDTPKKPAKREEPLDSQGEETATSDADELTTYEKGIQQKFNSVSSVSSSDSLNVVTTTVRNMDQPVNNVVHDTSGVSEKVEKLSLNEQSEKSTQKVEKAPENGPEKIEEVQKTEEKVETEETENSETKENEPIGTDVKVNVIGDGVIELKRLDGSVRQSSEIYSLWDSTLSKTKV